VQPEKPVQKGYTESDLVLDDYYPVVADFMRARHNYSEEELADRENTVKTFINESRFFAGGNAPQAVSEIAFITKHSKDKDTLAKLGAGYDLFQNMSGLFSEDTTWGETAGGTWDYLRSALVDPVNYASLFTGGLAKAAVTGGSKVGTKVAQKLAMDAYTTTLRGKIAGGLTEVAAKELATKAAEKVFGQSMLSMGVQKSAQMGVNRAARMATTSAFGKLTNKGALAAIIASGSVDTLSAIGTDVAYQKSLIKTGAQEEYNPYQTGLAALAGIAMSGVQAGLQLRSGASNLALPSVDVAKPVSGDVVRNFRSSLLEGDWKAKVAAGKELKDQDTEFFIRFILGDDSLKLKGLSQSLYEAGYVWQRRSEDDSISNFVTDILKDFDPTEARGFLQDFEKATGVKMPETTDALKDMETFSNIFAKKVSDGGRLHNALSQMARKLGKDVEDVTFEDMVTDALGQTTFKGKTVIEKAIFDKLPKNIATFQNNVIRGIVSNLSTTGLNFRGWRFNTLMNSITDLSLAGVHGGAGFWFKWTGNEVLSKEQLRIAGQLVEANIQKAKNLLDPDMTLEAFESLALKSPKDFQSLLHTFAGGVDNSTQFTGRLGFDPEETVLSKNVERGMEVLQKLGAVRAVDMLTKSQEYVYQLDKALRISSINKGWSEFFDHPNAAKMMNTKEFMEASAKALYETERALMSHSFRGAGGFTGEFATLLEDFRKLPGLGLLVPFGRFFNNTIATMMDGAGLSLVGKLIGKQKMRSTPELVIRAASAWGLIFSMGDSAKSAIDQGLGLFETRSPSTGDVKDWKYEYPASVMIGTAKVLEYLNSGDGSVPKGIAKEYLEVIGGQLTRDLSDTATGIFRVVEDALTGDIEPLVAAGRLLGGILEKPTAGITRAFEPYNDLAGLLRGNDFVSPDRRQGSKVLNNSLRYIDQFTGAIFGDLEEQKYNPVSGAAGLNPTKYMTVREGRAPTYTSRLLNTVGIRDFDKIVASYSDAEKADNRYNKIFNLLVEERSKALWNLKGFQGRPREEKEVLIRDLIKDVATMTKDLMKQNVVDSGDRRLAKMLSIANLAGSISKIDKALKAISQSTGEGGELKFDDLTEGQLDMLETYLKQRDTIIRLK